MKLKGNPRPVALMGGICALRDGFHFYEETLATIVYQDGVTKEVIKLDDDVDIDRHIADIRTRYNDLQIVRSGPSTRNTAKTSSKAGCYPLMIFRIGSR